MRIAPPHGPESPARDHKLDAPESARDTRAGGARSASASAGEAVGSRGGGARIEWCSRPAADRARRGAGETLRDRRVGVKASAAIRRNGSSLREWLSYVGRRILLPLGRARRRQLRDALVVAVTGSAGKSTTKNLIAAVLAARWPGQANVGSRNRVDELLLLLLRARRCDRFLVQELGARGPDSLDELIWTLEPQIGVVTSVGTEHRVTFRTLEATAREKAKLVERLPASGLAVLNADDPRVLAMRERTPARVVLVGTSPAADLRAEEIESAWPEPLRLVARAGEERVEVTTRLHGVHWAPAVLAALAVGREAGLSLSEAAAAIGGVSPHRHRMSEVELPGGLTVLEDDWKSAEWSLDLAVDVVRRARAGRKIVVLGQISDSWTPVRRLYPRTAERFLEVAEMVIVVGQFGRYVRLEDRHAGRLRIVPDARAAHELLEELQRPGDLVLVKANVRPHHLERLVLARQDGQNCWLADCKLKKFCHDCARRFRPAG
jgi:UDP-N-acetylmuramoyl-tripeptide--D-alanyl-D-alanine ligase